MISVRPRVANIKLSAIVTTLAIVALLPSAAASARVIKQYVPKPHAKCRAHYARRRKLVKRHGRKVRETVCVYIAPKATPHISAPSTGSGSSTAVIPQPTPAVTIGAHLNPTFAQGPTNPLAVTYTYGASATQTVDGVTTPDTNLPPGILDLYSDGLLVCSINVGGSTTGGQCLVTYQTTGAHTVIVTYVTGLGSATETDTEQINPLGTVTTLTVVGPFSCGTDTKPSSKWCYYKISGGAAGQNGTPLGPLKLPSRFTISPTTGQASVMTGNEYGTPIELKVQVTEGTTETYSELTSEPHDQYGGSLLADVPGDASWWVVAGYAGSVGWSASQSAPQTLSP